MDNERPNATRTGRFKMDRERMGIDLAVAWDIGEKRDGRSAERRSMVAVGEVWPRGGMERAEGDLGSLKLDSERSLR